MTIAELILKLQDYDQSALVCIQDEQVFPALDEVYPPEEIRGHMCVVICSTDWP